MAVTKIHPIKSTLKKALDYIENPAKTDEKMLVSSFACSYETADIEFELLLSQAMQKGNNLAHHLIQSFAPDETTPEQAHEIGRQLADEVLQGKYPYVLTTHIDKGHVHNHIIFCAVDMLPAESIQDYEVCYTLNGADAQVDYKVFCEGAGEISVQLLDAENKLVAEANGVEGALCVQNAHLWQVRNAYLYTIVITLKKDGLPVDEYRERIGIRTVEIRGTKILINGKPVYLKGFGKHEDFDILGRGFNWAVAKRDFECMKWTNANCFRTSHYPYAEEWYQMADEEGFLIIDEVPAVGMMRSTHNFAAAGTGQYTYFFETPTVPELLKNHIQQVKEMMARDKNHPSVFAWSLFNEPETTSEYAKDYFTKVFEAARTLDPQNRPLTGAFEKNSAPDKCRCYQLCDFICLNRYYGWYISGGAEMEEAEVKFRAEMDKWAAKKLNVPFVFTEFGTDTLATEHKLPAIMWSQEYQNEYLAMNFSVFDSYDFVQGELVWNFADFQTSEGVMRVNGNKKGIFTRQRQPKDAAFTFKKRWESLPLNYKGE